MIINKGVHEHVVYLHRTGIDADLELNRHMRDNADTMAILLAAALCIATARIFSVSTDHPHTQIRCDSLRFPRLC